MKNKYNENDYKNKCSQLNLKYVGYHKEHKKGTIIEFICQKHIDKDIQFSDWSHFRNAKVGCPYCYGRKRSNKDIIPLIKNKSIELLSNYKGCEKPIKCKCQKCGNIWTTIPKVLTSNGSGCPKCGREKVKSKRSKSHNEFIMELRKINPNITILEKYNGAHRKIKCKCNLDGHIWYGYPSNLLNQSAGCPVCNLSNAERKMLLTLDRLNINYIPQYSTDGCKYKYKLKFDAFYIKNQIAFEYNGEQHYKPIDFAGKGEEWAKQQLELTQKRDKAKIEYCKNNNIPIIIIPYWEKDNMEFFIIEKLKKIGVNKN